MNDIKVFENPEFGQVHTVVSDGGDVWFCAKDVCDILGYGNGRQALASHVDEADVQKLDVRYAGQIRQMSYVNESGLFSLIIGSTLPRAKHFKHWVTSEVLPSIRKYGVYASEEFLANAIRDPQFAIGILSALNQEKEKSKQLLIANSEQQKQIEENKPLVTFAQTVDMSENSISMGNMAKMLKQAGINIGRNRLLSELRTMGFLCKQGSDWNAPSQLAMERGLFTIKETTFMTSNGRSQTGRSTQVTGKGQIYFINLFKERYHGKDS